MDDSLSRWLRLREPADVVARSHALTRLIVDGLSDNRPLSLLDLGTGTGSNIRYLAERLPAPQRWLAVDRSDTLLVDLVHEMRAWAASRGYQVSATGGVCEIRGADVDCSIETRQMDLGGLEDPRMFEGRHLVTASALLDLVSAEWLDTLAQHCRNARASALFTITYNGVSSCTPGEPEDDLVRDLLNQHQKRNKGLGGPAEGPDAETYAERAFTRAGYQVRSEPSDWILSPAAAAMQRMLIDGWATAATEQAPEQTLLILDWHKRRLAHVDEGRSAVVVGHNDMAAWLPRD